MCGTVNTIHEDNMTPVINTNVDRIPVLQQEEVIIGDELVFMKPVARTRLTEARLEKTYRPGGSALAPFQRVYAVGVQASDAIRALGDKIGWDELADFRFEEPSSGIWFCRFTADGTSMKAGGRFVPGGCILDWWK